MIRLKLMMMMTMMMRALSSFECFSDFLHPELCLYLFLYQFRYVHAYLFPYLYMYPYLQRDHHNLDTNHNDNMEGIMKAHTLRNSSVATVARMLMSLAGIHSSAEKRVQ